MAVTQNPGAQIVRRRVREYFTAYLYLTPAGLVFLVFTLLPALFVLYISLFNWNFLNEALSRWVGIGNYRDLVTSAQFWHSLLITGYFLLGTVPVGVIVALLIAMFLMDQVPGRALVRLAVFAPYVTPIVATSIIWLWIFNPQYGLLNAVLHLLHLPELGWLQSPHWALVGIIIFTLWHSLGFSVIIFLAGLTGISTELREASRIDGATRLQELRHVVWPLLSPITLFVLVISTIGALQAFTQFYTMTAGGPLAATTTTSYLLYTLAFIFYNTGHAAALAVILFLIIGGLTLVQMGVSRRRTFYQ
jgi:multiple sugar transport system permease protein